MAGQGGDAEAAARDVPRRHARPAALAALGTRHGDDELAVGNRVLHLSYAGSSLSTAMDRPLARALAGVATTTRTWSTVVQLADLSRRC